MYFGLTQLQVAQSRIDYLEQSMVERSIVSRQESVICDLENKMEFQRAQIKRFEVSIVKCIILPYFSVYKIKNKTFLYLHLN